MSLNCNLLFVYGTLMRGDRGKTGRAQRSRLARAAKLIGSAWTAGRLYDLGRYPGLVLSEAIGDDVHGELLELIDAERTLRWLDAYEGIVPGQHSHNEYERVLRPVERLDSGRIHAWIYVFRQDVEPAGLITNGRWLGEG